MTNASVFPLTPGPEGVKKFPSWVRRGWSIVPIRSHRDLQAKFTTPEALTGFIPS